MGFKEENFVGLFLSLSSSLKLFHCFWSNTSSFFQVFARDSNAIYKLRFTAHSNACAVFCNSNHVPRYVSSLKALMCGIAAFCLCEPVCCVESQVLRQSELSSAQCHLMSTHKATKPETRKILDQFPS